MAVTLKTQNKQSEILFLLEGTTETFRKSGTKTANEEKTASSSQIIICPCHHFTSPGRWLTFSAAETSTAL